MEPGRIRSRVTDLANEDLARREFTSAQERFSLALPVEFGEKTHHVFLAGGTRSRQLTQSAQIANALQVIQ
jgi:hypothetical protein